MYKKFMEWRDNHKLESLLETVFYFILLENKYTYLFISTE